MEFNFMDIIKNNAIDVSAMSNRQKIEVVEWIFTQGENIADDIPVRNFIHGGMYAREATMIAGIAGTGKVHTEDHLLMISQGDITIMTDDDKFRVQAPFIYEAKANTKKLLFAHEDTVLTTIHATPLTDLAEIESVLMNDGDISWIDELTKVLEN
jgi:hypothetical protein